MLRFREDRVTQAAARLLRLRGGRMAYLKLIKLLYFADRRALAELGRPISFDLFVSMPHGPVLSRTYDLVASEPDPTQPSYWHDHISAPDADYSVQLLREPPNDQLSPAEESILDAVFARYGRLSRWQVRDESHALPEYRDPEGSSEPISIRDVLVHQGFSEEDAAAVVDALTAEAVADQVAG